MTLTLIACIAMNSNNPFAALGALRDSLPDGPEETPESPESGCKSLKAKDFKIFYERKGRGGKEVTIIECPDAMDNESVCRLAKMLKNSLGTGGSARGNEILLQGDRRRNLAEAITDSIKKLHL